MKLRRLIVTIVVMTLVLAGCASPQDTFKKSYELANQSYQSGDFAMARAHIEDALLALPDSAAGKELQKRIAYATFSKETLEGVREAASAGNWQVAMNLALKLDSNHPDESTANKEAAEVVNEFLKDFSTSEALADSEVISLQQAFSELLTASGEAGELAISQQLFESACQVLGTMQESRIKRLIDQGEFEASLDLALTLESSNLFASNASVEQSISKAKRSFESSILSQSRALAGSKEFNEASKLLRSALTELPGSEALDSELSRVVKLAQQEQERQVREAQEAKDRAVSAMVSVKDTFEDIEWIYDGATYSQYAGNKFLLYMGRKNLGTPWLRMRFMMYDDTWHFFETIKLDVDGVRYSYAPGYFGVDRDNGSGGIWEWYDFSPTSSDIQMVEAIIKSKDTRIRYINDDNFYVERTVSVSQKKALSRVLLAYEALGGIRP